MCCCKNEETLYYWTKYILFFYNFIFQVVGLALVALGIYSEVYRSTYTDIDHVFVTPAAFLIIVGMTVFFFASIGCMAALRDNFCMIYCFIALASVTLALEVGAGVAALVFKEPAKNFVNDYILKGLVTYYDDPDLKNVVDYVQVEFECCGGRIYKDWQINPYHNCSAPGPSACGVPFSCCVPNFEEDYVINSMCGYDTMHLKILEAVQIIHVYGCIDSVLDFVWNNLDILAGLLLGVILPQLAGIIVGLIYLDVLKKLNRRQQPPAMRTVEMRLIA